VSPKGPVEEEKIVHNANEISEAGKGGILSAVILIPGAIALGCPAESVPTPWGRKRRQVLAGRFQGQLEITITGVEHGKKAGSGVNIGHGVPWRPHRMGGTANKPVETGDVHAQAEA